MAFRKTLGLLIPLLFSMTTFADVVKINPNHPEQYTVVKGDTLWHISGRFLQHPWQWPELWSYNNQIVNPHLIYPGDTVYFSIVDGKPRLSFSKDNAIKPRIRELPADQALRIIPTDAIAQFLTSPKVLNQDDLDNADYIVGFADEHLIAGAGDRVYARTILNPSSLRYTIFRAGQAYVSQDTNEILGYEAKFIANTTLERVGDPATLLITESDHEVRRGDRIMVTDQSSLALNYFPKAPSELITGSIISVLDGVSQIGQHNIVVLDKGTADGLEEGHILDIYQRGKIIKDKFAKKPNTVVKLPNELAGVLMVFRPFERVSYALVLEATRAIHILDTVKTP